MDHLNCFVPYISKSSNHEDQLTRAFLILLRFVPLAQASFIDLIREAQLENESEQIIPTHSDLHSQITSIETQVGSINQDNGRIVSLGMTNEKWSPDTFVQPSERRAIYDGVIYYAPGWILIIENKPYSKPKEQLNPNIPKGSAITLDPNPIFLNWREVIERLSSLLERDLIQGAEALLVRDFIDFIDKNFSYLNPYTSFRICKDNNYLLKRRCISVMEKIAPGKVKYHRGWKGFIEIEGPVRTIDLYPEVFENGEWRIVLAMYPGATMTQAREFLNKLRKKEFLGLQEKGWKIVPDLHLSFRATNIATRTKKSLEEYILYWQTEKRLISQVHRSNFITLFQELKDKNLISEEDIPKLEEQFINSKRQTLNICPGLALYYSWSKPKAIELDSQDRFEEELRFRIQEAIVTWGQQPKF